MTAAIVWFRRDLRLDDHAALDEALAMGADVVPLFVRDPSIERAQRSSARRKAMLDAALAGLHQELTARSSRLVVRTGIPADVVPAVAREVGATVVHAHRDYTPYARRRDESVGRSVRLELHDGQLLTEPESLGDTKVFAAFHRRWLTHVRTRRIPAPVRISTPTDVASEPIGKPPAGATPQSEASDLLEAFTGKAHTYAAMRDRLDLDATSHLSPHLHLGTISVQAVTDAVTDPSFRRQLAWRDWASHLLWWRPETAHEAWRPDRRHIEWVSGALADQRLTAWQEGRTGYPTVDAGMRQLAATGWMANRARLIVASFLTKDLFLDWREGERWFLQRLVDGDIANNSLGWQWTAGVGTDAAPYFRLMNPQRQGERFDPHGDWVRQWVPELAHIPDASIHAPWMSPAGFGSAYPSPIVDHAAAAAHVRAAFRSGEERASADIIGT